MHLHLLPAALQKLTPANIRMANYIAILGSLAVGKKGVPACLLVYSFPILHRIKSRLLFASSPRVQGPLATRYGLWPPKRVPSECMHSPKFRIQTEAITVVWDVLFHPPLPPSTAIYSIPAVYI